MLAVVGSGAALGGPPGRRCWVCLPLAAASRHDGANGRRHRHVRIRRPIPVRGGRTAGGGHGATGQGPSPSGPGPACAAKTATRATTRRPGASGQDRVPGQDAPAPAPELGGTGPAAAGPGGGPATGPSTTAGSSGPTSTGRLATRLGASAVLPPRPGAGRARARPTRSRSTAGCSTGAPRPCSSWPRRFAADEPDRRTPVPFDPVAMRAQLTRMAGAGHAGPHRRPRRRAGHPQPRGRPPASR